MYTHFVVVVVVVMYEVQTRLVVVVVVVMGQELGISSWDQSSNCPVSLRVRSSSVKSWRHAKHPPSVANETRVPNTY